MTQEYLHLSHRDQILLRPEQHIGSTSLTEDERYVATDTGIGRRNIAYNPGLVHIFYEVLSNAQDNYFRSQKTKTPLKSIQVTVQSKRVSVRNDGMHISVTKHKWKKGEQKIRDDMYEPEIIFGYLNSSGNYNDVQQARTGAGLHGVGVKLTNIFSTQFAVECYDPKQKQKFTQTFKKNMSVRNEPKVTDKATGPGYTKITYDADFSRFEGVTEYDEAHLAVMRKLCVDCAVITGANITFNGDKIKTKSLKEYAGYFVPVEHSIECKSVDSTVLVVQTDSNAPRHVSFVNGIVTDQGGVHVNEWSKALFTPLLERLKKKYPKLTLRQLKDHFTVFVVCNLENPRFAGQTKGSLTSPKPKVNVPKTRITAMLKWPFVDRVAGSMEAVDEKELKKTDGRKTERVKIDKADDANWAGTKRSHECTLFVTEGDSAKQMVLAGLSGMKQGTDRYGVMPVRGKVLNVRNAKADQINANAEICKLKKLLGLQNGVDYSVDKNFRSLRYGHVILLTDVDVDGFHISGLLMNYFYHTYPTLASRDYMQSIEMPIVKATLGKTTHDFYSLTDYRRWADTNKTHKAKYYKGLGTNNDREAIEMLRSAKTIQFTNDRDAPETLSKVFCKTRADDRKRWIGEYVPSEPSYPVRDNTKLVKVSEFVNHNVVQFSVADNTRSLPSVVDGFKAVQRKILWVALTELKSKEMKVAQFAPLVASRSQYHHGEVSLQNAVVKMAQSFVGSNNLPFLTENGQFGSRVAGGNDAAAGRYIYTQLHPITRYVFRAEDDPVLEYLDEEGQSVEPRHFVPIIPTVLVNGAHGIGTGYAADIFNHNPTDLIKWVREWIKKKQPTNEPVPWYRGYTGTIESDGKTMTSTGIVERTGTRHVIRELPVGTWTDDYKSKLDSLDHLTNFKTYSDKFTVYFEFDSAKPMSDKSLWLTKRGSANLTAWSHESRITEYASIVEMLDEFCTVRLRMYVKRKAHMIAALKQRLAELESKVRFIALVLKDVTVLRKTEEQLFDMFARDKYHRRDDSYRYLTEMPVRQLTRDKYESLKRGVAAVKADLERVEKTAPRRMWWNELDEFEREYKKLKMI